MPARPWVALAADAAALTHVFYLSCLRHWAVDAYADASISDIVTCMQLVAKKHD